MHEYTIEKAQKIIVYIYCHPLVLNIPKYLRLAQSGMTRFLTAYLTLNGNEAKTLDLKA